ncbi:MAG: DUF3164 family protein [Alphaproteobacteria bacterium]|nr:DUF3164 family protein [Alphaproteobacteria bacterium]
MINPTPSTEFLTDAQGRKIAAESVKAEDRLENDFVLELFAKAQAISGELADFKKTAFEVTDVFMQLLAEQYHVKKGGKKGNVTFTSYDGMTKIQVSNADFIVFGPQLKIAQELIGDFIKEEAEGGISDSLKTLVFNAFRVDKEGRVNKAEILALRRYDIKSEIWAKAMEAINDSIRVSATKRYIRFYRRPSIDADFQAVNLDLAKV